MYSKKCVSRLTCAALSIAALLPAVALADSEWRFSGANLQNTRSATSESHLRPDNVSGLHVKWVFTAHGDVSATPAVQDGAVYVPDWGGWINKLDAATGAVLWTRRIQDFTGVPNSRSRNTPALRGDRLFLGTLDGRLLALDKNTGDLIWQVVVDPHPAAVITQSPIAFGDRVYVGVASYEESFQADPTYPCCTFRGNVLALDAQTGAEVWRTYVVPQGYAGGGVWGSTLAVDTQRNSLYVTTGNNSYVPPDARVCLLSASDDATAAACLASDDYFDSILALDLTTGARKWGHKFVPSDVFVLSCLIMPENCPPPGGPDFDFGQGAAFFQVPAPEGETRDLVGAGQKNGIYWALDPDTGATVWHTQVGPGSLGGGMMWGSAVANGHVYAALHNFAHTAYTLQPSGQSSAWGNFTGLDATTGQILWQTPDPVEGAIDGAPITTANGVVFGCSLDPQGHMYALDGQTGTILWSFASGGSCNGGAAVVDGTVYWGSGYSNFGAGTANNKLYAFTVD